MFMLEINKIKLLFQLWYMKYVWNWKSCESGPIAATHHQSFICHCSNDSICETQYLLTVSEILSPIKHVMIHVSLPTDQDSYDFSYEWQVDF